MAYEETKVPVSRSQDGIRSLLRKHGARRFAFGEDFGENGTPFAVVRFEHEGLAVRLKVPLKLIDEDEAERRTQYNHKSVARTLADQEERESRRIWRVIHHNLKARMESVEEGVETFVEAFMAHVVNRTTGMTIYEELAGTVRVELPEPLPQRALPEAGE